METIKRKTHKLNASGQSVGRLATEIVVLLRGKNKPNFEPHVDGGDFVEVTSCKEMKFTGKKLDQKEYITHSNYPGGLKRKKIKEVFEQDPGEVLRRAVLGMLPKINSEFQNPKSKFREAIAGRRCGRDSLRDVGCGMRDAGK